MAFRAVVLLVWLLPAVTLAQDVENRPPAMGGFELAVTLSDVSGLYFSRESYANQTSLVLSPSYALGKKLFPGKWAEPLSLSAELGLESQLAGRDERFSSRSFGSPQLFNSAPERIDVALSQPSGGVDGARSHPALISDLSVGLSHGELARIPFVGAGVRAEVSTLWPTSTESRNGGLYNATSLGVGLSRGVGPVEAGYDLQVTKYFYSSTVAPIRHLDEPVMVNGQPVTPWQPDHSGVRNPSHGLAQTLWARGTRGRFSLDLRYGLLITALYPLAGCAVPGVETADVCRDGPRVGDVKPDATRDTHFFTAEAGAEVTRYLSFALALSTLRPVRALDGELTQPFFHVNRDNATTLSLSATLSVDPLLQEIRR